MEHSRFTKVVSIILIIAISTCYLFAQYDVIYDTPAQPTTPSTPVQRPDSYTSMTQGTIDGQNDAKGNILYGCGGFACGVFGFLAAAVSNPQPSPAAMAQLSQTKGPEYAMAYRTAYTKKAKSQNMIYAGVGWAAAVAVVLINYANAPDNSNR